MQCAKRLEKIFIIVCNQANRSFSGYFGTDGRFVFDGFRPHHKFIVCEVFIVRNLSTYVKSFCPLASGDPAAIAIKFQNSSTIIVKGLIISLTNDNPRTIVLPANFVSRTLGHI